MPNRPPGQQSLSRSDQLAGDEKAVIDAALRVFIGWKEATIGNPEGVLRFTLTPATSPTAPCETCDN